ncbi:MAG: carboxypeptidase regulatory-like domain-containing protein, partial [Terriglobia bacterium]
MKTAATRFGILLATICVAAMVFGQAVTSSITGTVRDASGAVIPGASVTVSDSALGFTRKTTTDSAGSFLAGGLPAGTYDLIISSTGFKTYRATGVVVQAARKIRADATLQVGEVSTEVTVQGSDIGQVQTQTSELGGTVTGRQITQLELNGRSFVQLLTLVPGVANMTGSDSGPFGQAASAYSVNGGRIEYNNMEVDGISIMDMGTGGNSIVIYPSIDAIAEERVLTSNYGAQYGQDASGTIIAAIKSGTSQFHGDAYEFNRNEIFNARNFFSDSRPSY